MSENNTKGSNPMEHAESCIEPGNIDKMSENNTKGTNPMEIAEICMVSGNIEKRSIITQMGHI